MVEGAEDAAMTTPAASLVLQRLHSILLRTHSPLTSKASRVLLRPGASLTYHREPPRSARRTEDPASASLTPPHSLVSPHRRCCTRASSNRSHCLEPDLPRATETYASLPPAMSSHGFHPFGGRVSKHFSDNVGTSLYCPCPPSSLIRRRFLSSPPFPTPVVRSGSEPIGSLMPLPRDSTVGPSPSLVFAS